MPDHPPPVRCASRPAGWKWCSSAGGRRYFVRQERFDIVHNQIGLRPRGGHRGGGCHRFYLQEVLPLEKGRLVAGLRRASALHLVLLALERQGYRPDRCPYIIANSSLGRDGILQYYPMPPERVVVAYNGVDARRFSPEARGAGERSGDAPSGSTPKISGSLRRDRFAKDRAVRRLGFRTRSLALRRFGSALARHWGPASRRRRERIRPPLAVPGRKARSWVIGCGLRAGSRPGELLRAATLFALPTSSIRSPSTLEAMASGLPVVTVATRTGLAEILRPGVAGWWWIGPNDVEGLRMRLASAFGSGTRRRALGEQAGRQLCDCAGSGRWKRLWSIR